MTPTATYIAEENCLQEEPQMEKPKRPFAGNYSPQESPEFRDDLYHYEANLEIYNAHLATLRKIPCDSSCKGVWADGQKVVEGKDYEVRACCESNCNGVCEQIGATIWAIPLVPVKSEDEFEREAILWWREHYGKEVPYSFLEWIHNTYSLTKR